MVEGLILEKRKILEQGMIKVFEAETEENQRVILNFFYRCVLVSAGAVEIVNILKEQGIFKDGDDE